jgi:hypothetical protein
VICVLCLLDKPDRAALRQRVRRENTAGLAPAA